jgi:hypothetical protein
VLVAVFALSGCAASDLPVFCDETLWGAEWDVDGLPAAETPPEWVVTREIPFVRPDNGADIHVWLPWDMNRRQAYMLRGEEPVHARVRFMVASEAPEESLRVFVNGRLISALHDGVLTSDGRTPLVEGLAETFVEIPNNRFDVGMNCVTLESRENRSTLGWAGPDYRSSFFSFSVFLENADAPARPPDTEDYELGVHDPNFPTTAWVTLADGTERSLLLREEHPSPGSPVSITMRVQANPAIAPRAAHCEGADVPVDTTVYLALLDGEQVAMGDDGSIVATMPPGEQRVFHFEVELPDDGEPHLYEIIALSGQGRPHRLIGGDILPPWGVISYKVATSQWGDG